MSEPAQIPPTSTGETEKSVKPWSPTRQVFSIAFFIGAIAGIGTDLGDEFSSSFRQLPAKEFYVGAGALGAAFAAVNVAVLAMVVVWFDGPYQLVLEHRGGWATAMRPFRIIGTVSVVTTIASIVGLLVLGFDHLWLNALMLGVTGGLLSWSLFGTIVVINNLFAHGTDRAEQLKEIREIQAGRSLPTNPTMPGN